MFPQKPGKQWLRGDSQKFGGQEKGDSAEKQKPPSFFKGAKAEFKKISWPDRQSTLKQSVAVVAISVVVGVIIAVLDYFIQYGVNFLTSL